MFYLYSGAMILKALKMIISNMKKKSGNKCNLNTSCIL